MAKSKVNHYIIKNSPKQTERVNEVLGLLGLEGMRSSFEKLAEQFIKNLMTPYDFLENLLEKEMVFKEENRIQRWMQQARFPWKKTLADFNFSFQPSLNQRLIYELASCRFIDKTENVVFFGPPGVGKTHLAIALGIEAINKGYEVRFLTLGLLIDLVEKAGDGEKLRRLLGSLLRTRLFILDEMDLYETNSCAGTFLFKLLHQRYEKGSEAKK